MKTSWYKDLAWLEPEIASCIHECHESMAEAQSCSKLNGNLVYGAIWNKLLSSFASLKNGIPRVSTLSVPKAGYKLITIDQYVLFPWRFSSRQDADIEDQYFRKSDTREKIFNLSPAPQQLELDLDGLYMENQESDELEIDSKIFEKYSVVIVGLSSNSSAIHKVIWGLASLDENGHITINECREIDMIGPSSDRLENDGESFDNAPTTDILVTRKNKESQRKNEN